MLVSFHHHPVPIGCRWMEPIGLRNPDALFAVLWRTDDHRMDDLPAHPVMRRWWAHMADIMATQPDGAPVAVPLVPMFHLP